jgi:nitrilase
MANDKPPAVNSVRVAVVQAEPMWFDLESAVRKTIHYITEAANDGAKLVTFPEVWIPGYPNWIW